MMNKKEFQRSRIISIGLTVSDSIIFIICRMLKYHAASSIIIFMAVISILLLTGLIGNKIDNEGK